MAMNTAVLCTCIVYMHCVCNVSTVWYGQDVAAWIRGGILGVIQVQRSPRFFDNNTFWLQ